MSEWSPHQPLTWSLSLSLPYHALLCFNCELRTWEEIRKFISKYRHTFTYGEFKLLPERNSAGPWAGTPVRGGPWVGSGAFWSVLLRLAAGVTCCTLGFEHLAPEIFPSQVAALHLLITENKQRRELNVWKHLWKSLKFLSTSCQWHLGNSCWMIFEGLGFRNSGSGSGRRETEVDSLSWSWKVTSKLSNWSDFFKFNKKTKYYCRYSSVGVSHNSRNTVSVNI